MEWYYLIFLYLWLLALFYYLSLDLVTLYKTCYLFPFFFLYSIKFIAFKRWLPCCHIKYKHYLQRRCYSWGFYYVPLVQKQRKALQCPHSSLAQPWSYFWLDSFLVSLLQINWISQCFSNNFCSFLSFCLYSIYFFTWCDFLCFWAQIPFTPVPFTTYMVTFLKLVSCMS